MKRWASSVWVAVLVAFACSLSNTQPRAFNLVARPSNPTCIAPPRPAAVVRVVRAFPRATFDQPVSLALAPDHATWLVGERRGRVWRIDATDEQAEPHLVLDIAERVNASSSAIGLLAIAVHPNNGSLFVSYTGPGGTVAISYLSRFPLTDDGAGFDASRESRLLEMEQISDYHVNTDLRFGPDGYLYVGFGDGGPHNDPLHRAQDPNELKGKILRLDVDAATSYASPRDNPFASGGGRPEVWALGLRNPWRFSFDRETGELWTGDVGQDRVEEIDRITRGGNYGWAVREGDRCVAPPACNAPNVIEPVISLPHPEVSSVTFGAVYRGEAIPALRGHLIYGDYPSGVLWEADPSDPKPRMINSDGHAVVSFAEDDKGELLVVDLRGSLWRVLPGHEGPADVPQLLSATGCFERNGKPAAGLIPYEVNVPFWSDGDSKNRWFAIPDGTKISFGADGRWEFPIGSVVAKEFTLGNTRVETRLFVRHPDGEWAGYLYRWDPSQRDATLVPTGATGASSTWPQRWYFPHRGECMRCHNTEAGHVLGLELRQLHRTIDVNGRAVDQVAAFERIGLFNDAVPETDVLPTKNGTVEQRARAWLHANCAYCHRPNGSGQGDMDLRVTTPLAQTGLCKAPSEGTYGLKGARRIAPGNPALSLVSRRIHATGYIRMPPLGTMTVDKDGIAIVDQWIRELRCE